MGGALHQVIPETPAVESCVKVSHHLVDRTYRDLCCCAIIPDLPSHRYELVFPVSFRVIDERYIPPIVDPDNPEIRNSDNTVLFLVSCYQYIMIAIILSVGPPYRQPMVQNRIPLSISILTTVPFMVTIVTAALFTTIAILIPPPFVASILQLTYISVSFAFLLIAIALGNFAVSWFSEKVIFVQLRNALDRFALWRRKRRKHWSGNVKIKRYQVVEEGM